MVMVMVIGSTIPPSLMILMVMIWFLILCSTVTATAMAVSTTTTTAPTPALYVFGDSLVDSGNNNLLPTLAKANYLPYGANFGRGPTGRFTNGKTIADFIAEFLGLPLSPPYLSLQSQYLSTTGINYASGSCGILPETGKTGGKCLSMSEQIELFQTTIEQKIMPIMGTKFESYMEKSVFIVSMGSNDYINNYLLPIPSPRKHYSPQYFAQLLVHSLSGYLQRLYEMGGRKIIVFEIGPIGCIPAMTRTNYHVGKCVENMNKFAKMFNYWLGDMIENLSSTLQGSQFIFGRVHDLAYDAIINPSKYGIVDTSGTCCVTWENGTLVCIPGTIPCFNPDKHFFWDGFHLTEAVYKMIVQACIHNSSICTPNSINQLITFTPIN